ncbi:MAG TPA: NAD(P)/FAD-dependent oxidoreductase, partial [Polyangiaceae bacterium]|nr:NAD(P)/FAD-dependent oxidoreductase [Polyangiaceae bacterium]
EEALALIGRFLQYYREQAKYLERTYAFVARVGIEKIRAVVVEDSEGIAARLDAELERALAAYRDPWLEAETPASPNQFRATLPVVS